MKMIAAVDNNWGIGKNGQLLVTIPEDLAYFKRMTIGKAVIMGRKTAESLPNGKPLQNRTNIVLSKTMTDETGGFVVVNNEDDLFELIRDYKTDDLFVIGGEMLYELLSAYCDTAYITKINVTFDADRYMPRIDLSNDWQLCESTHLSTQKYNIEFCKYKRTQSERMD